MTSHSPGAAGVSGPPTPPSGPNPTGHPGGSAGGSGAPAVDAVLDGLVREGVLSAGQAATVGARLGPVLATSPGRPAPTTAQPDHSPRKVGAVLIEIAGYVGGAMVLSGLGALVGLGWEGMSQAARLLVSVVATLLLGGAAATVGLVPFGGPELREARTRLASTLGALAAGAAAIVVAIPVRDADELLAGAFTALVVALLGYVLLRGAPLLATIWLAALLVVGDVLDRQGDLGAFTLATCYAGLAVLFLAVGVLGGSLGRVVGARGERWLREPGVAVLLGGFTGLGAAEIAIVEDENRLMALYGLGIGVAVAVACLGGYLLLRRWSMLVAPVFIALVVPATALAALFESALLAALTVAVIGALLLAGGGVALAARSRQGGHRTA